MSDDLREQLAGEIEKRAKERAPVRSDVFRRKMETGSIGMPVWLHRLLLDAGWDGHIRIVEVGGRGILHANPAIGWVSIAELRELADKEADDE